ncbi:NUDIX domain-containing protein [Mucilaginibacter sp.]|jgi:predicted NUDIX family NTP pyrophosphohydrolase|uniref:NUDIX domain-containing protein n=1 Tax=Mucilaginibacter sp. TaxID=1882438 RepID=UPI002CE6B575|nr:NUDIX domain-containing protein [Mucilaginibacter sp.]HTI57829.1 NUDIX domain-containing protein [Mucilaginibacter sp.]
MAKQSAGILLFRFKNKQPEVFLVHPGGPFFRNKDDGAWSIPKGEFTDGEEALDAAVREFEEETGLVLTGEFIPLDPVTQKGGKKVYAWAIAGDIDHETIVSNTFEIEWPPRSAKKQTFPEVDKAGWFDVETAKVKINAAQVEFLKNLLIKLKSS